MHLHKSDTLRYEDVGQLEQLELSVQVVQLELHAFNIFFLKKKFKIFIIIHYLNLNYKIIEMNTKTV